MTKAVKLLVKQLQLHVAVTVDAKVEGDGTKSTIQALLNMGTFNVVDGR